MYHVPLAQYKTSGAHYSLQLRGVELSCDCHVTSHATSHDGHMTHPLTLKSHPQGDDRCQSQTEEVVLSSRYQILVHTVRGGGVRIVICVGVEYTQEGREKQREGGGKPVPAKTTVSVCCYDGSCGRQCVSPTPQHVAPASHTASAPTLSRRKTATSAKEPLH